MSQGPQEMTSNATDFAVPSPPVAVEPPRDPFRTLGIVGFVLSFFVIANIAGLIISIVALVRSKKAGFKNRFAVAGTVIASIGVVLTVAGATFVASNLVGAAETCARLGVGVHTVGAATYTCTPTSFHVNFGSTTRSPFAQDEQWVTANSLYSEAVCSTNAAREEVYAAIDTNDMAQVAPAATSTSSAFDAAADVFLDHSWPSVVERDIQILGDASTQLAESWAGVAESADLDSAETVPFPDEQAAFEASQRIRAVLIQHGQTSIDC